MVGERAKRPERAIATERVITQERTIFRERTKILLVIVAGFAAAFLLTWLSSLIWPPTNWSIF